MALTADQDLPIRPVKETEGWTTRRLFPMRATASAIAKAFVSPLEVLLAYLVLIEGLAVVFGREVPTLFYVLTLGILAGVIYERSIVHSILPPKPETKSKSK